MHFGANVRQIVKWRQEQLRKFISDPGDLPLFGTYFFDPEVGGGLPPGHESTLTLSYRQHAHSSAGRGLLGQPVNSIRLDNSQVLAIHHRRVFAQVVLRRINLSIGAEHAQQSSDGNGERVKTRQTLIQNLTNGRVEHQA